MMTLSWLTQRNLGSYAIGQSWLVDASSYPPAAPPLLIAYLAPAGSVISLAGGDLPPGLSWAATPNWVTITGTISDAATALVYTWTFRITDPSGQVLDQAFDLQVSTRPVPEWETLGDLGTFPETRSFNLEPLVLGFTADSRATVRLLNGQLPPGLVWTRSGSTLLITGESQDISATTSAAFTFRLANPNGKIADRTFSLVLVPAAQLPDWTGQATELGLIGSGQQDRFSVTAASSSTVTYSLVDPVPPGMAIDPQTGVISYRAPLVSVDTPTIFTVRARTDAASSTLTCSITVLTIPHAPVWITAPSVLQVAQRRYFELRLEAFDPLGIPLIYLPVSSSPGFPFTLDSDGLLYGLAPPVSADTNYEIVIKATTDPALLGPTVSSDQTFTITVLRRSRVGLLSWNTPAAELLGVMDGAMVNFDCGARSTRTVTVVHSVTGGQLPRGLMLAAGTGALVGFLDYHPVDKDYWFDITATDGVETITRTIRVQVVSSSTAPSITVDLPLVGEIKELWQSQNHALVGNGSPLANVGVVSSQFNSPSLVLVAGLGKALEDPDEIISAVDPWLQQMALSIGPVVTAAINGDQLLLRQVIDPQQGADRLVDRTGIAPDPLYPASLENLRQAFIDHCGFTSDSGSSSAEALVLVDPEAGSIRQILVTNGGSGYTSEPAVSIQGTGAGAAARARMQMERIRVIDPGQGWRVGDRIPLELGSYDRPAIAIVAEATPVGGLVRALITDPGVYSRVPELKVFITGDQGAVAGIELELNLSQIDVTAGGQGYGYDTTVSFRGVESLPSWSTSWSPEVPMLRMRSDAVELAQLQINSVPAVTALDGYVWSVDTAVMTLQGMHWQGTTRFDGDGATFDGGTTRFPETITPRQCLIDRGKLTFDLGTTTLDQGDQAQLDVQAAWGRTVIDGGMTAFDFYAVVFDPVLVAPSTHSSTRVQRIVHLKQPQHGNNASNDLW